MTEYHIEGKSPEQLVKDLAVLRVSPDHHLPAAISAQIQLQLVDRLCRTIDRVSEDIVRQSVNLKQYVEGANSNFVTEIRVFRESMEGIRASLRKFRESNKRASRALKKAIYVLAGISLIQAIMLIRQWLK